MKKNLPKTVYVQWYSDGHDEDDGYFVCDETAEAAADQDEEKGSCVGIYQLVRKVRLSSRTTVTETKIK